MEADDFAQRVADVAVLADPVRRDLYLYVASQPEPVSRDSASEGIGVPRHTAKFHLDKLVEQGLLDIDFQRLSGRQGPGAGRPTKLYRRSARQMSVTLPERRYDLAGHLMAGAIEDSTRTGSPILESLDAAAAALGGTIGDRARQDMDSRPDHAQRVATVCACLTAQGYEPHLEHGTIRLANCPFDALAREHTELVCGMNLALLDAVADRVGGGALTARLEPAAGSCCVVLDIDEARG